MSAAIWKLTCYDSGYIVGLELIHTLK